MRTRPGTAVSAVTVIAAVTVLAYFLAAISGYDAVLAYAGGFVPARVSDPGFLSDAGFEFPVLPMWLTPVGATLLHGGLLHLALNIIILLFCGRQVEAVLGRSLTLALYVAGAYAAALGQWAFDPMLTIPMVGASGAISAVLAAYALRYGSRDVRALGPIPAGIVRMLWLGAGWTALQFLIGIATSSGETGFGTGGSEIAIGAHIGGFIAGMILVRPLLLLRFGKSVT